MDLERGARAEWNGVEPQESGFCMTEHRHRELGFCSRPEVCDGAADCCYDQAKQSPRRQPTHRSRLQDGLACGVSGFDCHKVARLELCKEEDNRRTLPAIDSRPAEANTRIHIALSMLRTTRSQQISVVAVAIKIFQDATIFSTRLILLRVRQGWVDGCLEPRGSEPGRPLAEE